jgi:hypothetical protein
MAAVIGKLRERFEAALRAHDARAREPWSGPYHFKDQNDAISQMLDEIDDLLDAAFGVDMRRWNDLRVQLLRKLEAS